MKEKELPKYSETEYFGDKGVRIVDKVISEDLRWIFRDLRKIDLGIDGQIEMVDKEHGGTGRLLAVQIKCGESFFKEKSGNGFVFRGENKHLKYWLEHSLPVIVVICHPDSELCHWQEVTGANTVPLEHGWRMIIPESNLLGKNTQYKLTDIAGRPQHRDIIELLIYPFLHEKYTRKIEICTIFELSRDYHKYAYLAKIKDETVMIDFHYDPYGEIIVEDIEEIIRWKDYNNQVCGPNNPLHIYLVSESKDALNLKEDVKKYLDSLNNVEYFRLHYDKSPFFSVSEIDEKGEPIIFWPDD